MAAFANAEGGVIYIGVADDGSLSGLAPTDVTRCNQLISNVASQHVPNPLTVHTENVLVGDNRVVIVLTVPKGLDKPYFDKNGVIWLKTGADKRRVNSKSEEMSEEMSEKNSDYPAICPPAHRVTTGDRSGRTTKNH